MICIIPCGKAKQEHASPAHAMYIGGYHKMCRRYAQTFANNDRIFILSAKYGLLANDDIVQPYSLTLGQAGAVTAYYVIQQAQRFGILDETCVALGGVRYTKLCQEVWQAASVPLFGKNLFEQMHIMSDLVKAYKAK